MRRRCINTSCATSRASLNRLCKWYRACCHRICSRKKRVSSQVLASNRCCAEHQCIRIGSQPKPSRESYQCSCTFSAHQQRICNGTLHRTSWECWEGIHSCLAHRSCRAWMGRNRIGSYRRASLVWQESGRLEGWVQH